MHLLNTLQNLTHTGSLVYIVAPERGTTMSQFLARVVHAPFEVEIDGCERYKEIVKDGPRLIKLRRV
jgi:hypothetical protein